MGVLVKNISQILSVQTLWQGQAELMLRPGIKAGHPTRVISVYISAIPLCLLNKAIARKGCPTFYF